MSDTSESSVLVFLEGGRDERSMEPWPLLKGDAIQSIQKSIRDEMAQSAINATVITKLFRKHKVRPASP